MFEDHKPTLIYGGRDDEDWRKARVLRALGKIEKGLIPPIRWADDFKGQLYVGVDFKAQRGGSCSIFKAMQILEGAWTLIGEQGGVVYNTMYYPERTTKEGYITYDWILEEMMESPGECEEIRDADYESIKW